MNRREVRSFGPVNKAQLPADFARPDVPSAFMAPRDELERQLTKLWEGVLDIPNIGVRDNFFELTAARYTDNRLIDHVSLRAVTLFHEIAYDQGMRRARGKFRKVLPVATLLQAPTIEELANVLRKEAQSSSWSPLVPIHPHGSLPPFFVVHGAGAHVNFCYYLAHHLGTAQPFYGIQSRGLDGKRAPHKRIEAMAADYIKEVRNVQPQGPYFLGGRSLGGVIAFEMALQLENQGHQIAFLALLDSYAPGFFRSTSDKQDVKGLKENVTDFMQRMKGKMAMRKRKIRTRLRDANNRFYRGIDRPVPPALRNVQLANHKAYHLYVPRQYSGAATLFRAKNQPKRAEHAPYLGWCGLFAQGLQVIDVPGEHATIYHPPHVITLAEQLRSSLAGARESGACEKA